MKIHPIVKQMDMRFVDKKTLVDLNQVNCYDLGFYSVDQAKILF